MTFHPVFNEFLSTLVSNRVRFLVVGGHALAVHGRPRYTDDLDVWVEPTPTNAKRVVKALSAFGYDAYALHAAEFSTPDRMTHLGTPPLRIDIMTSVSGVLFGDAWANRVRTRIDGMPLSFIGRDEFIENKIASGQPKTSPTWPFLRRPSKRCLEGRLRRRPKRARGRDPRGGTRGHRR